MSSGSNFHNDQTLYRHVKHEKDFKHYEEYIKLCKSCIRSVRLNSQKTERIKTRKKSVPFWKHDIFEKYAILCHLIGIVVFFILP
eukprot:UN10252